MAKSTADLIRASMRKLGVLATGEQPSADELADGLEAFNALLESWNLERLFVYAILPTVYTLQAGKQKYTIGPGGDFDQARPNRIDQAYVRYDLNGTPTNDIPIQILNTDEWASTPVKDTPSTFPTQMYNDSANPLSNLYFYPYPSVNVKVVLYMWQELSSIAEDAVTDDLVLPPGYYRALTYALAVELAPDFGVSVPVEVAATSAEAKGNIKRENMPDLKMGVDDALTANRTCGFNIVTGAYQQGNP